MRISKNTKVGSLGFFGALALACASLVSGTHATAQNAENIGGTQRVYGNIPPDQIEHLSTSDRIKSAAASGSMMAIWETLEHGERVECLDCIPSVEPLLYDKNPRTREIAAWWLRRRIFGVFGEGEVYQRTLKTLAEDPDPVSRKYAANAVGEFLAFPGVAAVSSAIDKDADPGVRAAAATALGRLNDEGTIGNLAGQSALAKALADGDPGVRLAALKSAGRVNNFKSTAAVVRLTTDPDAMVRRNAAELIGGLRAAEGVDGLIALAKDPDANVRNSAAHALGALHDARARGVLEDLAKNDADRFVRDQAQIALRRL